MATVTYYIRSTSSDKKELHSIRVRFRHGDQYLYAKSGYFIEIENWNSKTQRVPPKKVNRNNKDLNNNLGDLEVCLLNCWKDAPNRLSLDKKWLQRQIDKYHLNEDVKKPDLLLLDFIESFIKSAPNEVDDRTGKRLSFRTIQRYKTAEEKLKEFVNKNFPYIDLNDIGSDFYKQYVQFLTHEKKLAVNTVAKEIAVLKKFLNVARQLGYSFNLEDFKKPTEVSESIYLNEKELEILYKHDLSKNKRLEKVRDLFIVGCWTGLRYSDLTSIKPKDFKNEKIYINQFKTDNPVIIPANELVKAIFKKYDYKLPTNISNPKFNEYIKEVCKAAELNEIVSKRITKGGKVQIDNHEKHELVTVHTARRSFATNLYLDGFATLSIMAITGHKTERAFLAYIKVTQEEHAKKLAEHWKK